MLHILVVIVAVVVAIVEVCRSRIELKLNSEELDLIRIDINLSDPAQLNCGTNQIRYRVYQVKSKVFRIRIFWRTLATTHLEVSGFDDTDVGR